MNALTSELLPAGEDVPFTRIGDAMARGTCHASGATPMRALVATVVAVGPSERLAAAAEALQTLGDAGTVRGILISEGDNAAPPARVAGNTVALHGLKPSFFNNAVAALRLSSLPTLVWWRGGRADTLDGLAELADRIVLDYDRPATASSDDTADPIWSRAATLFDDCAFSDLRWARLTQWRALMAHFFDIPEVLAAAADFSRLRIAGSDRQSAHLFAAWLRSSIQFHEGFTVDLSEGSQGTPIDEIRLGDGGSGACPGTGGPPGRSPDLPRDRGRRSRPPKRVPVGAARRPVSDGPHNGGAQNPRSRCGLRARFALSGVRSSAISCHLRSDTAFRLTVTA